MRKKNFVLVCATAGLLLAVLAAAAALVLKHEPAFYEQAAVPSSAERAALSKAFLTGAMQLWEDAKFGKGKWGHSFSQAQLNSFFEEDFIRIGEAENLRKLGISEPRVVLEKDRIRLAFRYGAGALSTVVSYDLRVWRVAKEANLIAVEVRSRRAGALAMSSHALLSDLTQLAGRNGMEVTLYRHEGHPVALIRIQADQARATTLLESLQVEPGHLYVGGASPDFVEAAAEPHAEAPSGN